MKLKKQYFVLFSLAGFLTACSTTSTTSDQSTSDPLISSSTSQTHLDTQNSLLAKQTVKINQLEQTLAGNQDEILQLTRQLDSQEAKLSQLKANQQDTKAAHLLEIEAEKQKLVELEAKYIALKLENEQLALSLEQLKALNQEYKTQILANNLILKEVEAPELVESKYEKAIDEGEPDYDVLNKMHRTLLHKYSALDADYQSLDTQYLSKQKELDDLQTQYARLEQINQKSRSDYALLKQQNLDLGGAISDARAQQQTLWDQIQVKDNIISRLEADNSALRDQSSAIESITSGQVTTALPAVDNSLKLGTLNAKVLVLESEIAAQKKLLSEYQSKLSNLEQSDDKSDLKNIEIARLGQALADLESEHKELTYEFEQIELAQQVSQEQQLTLLQDLTQARANLAELTLQKQRLEEDLKLAQTELIDLQGRYENSLLALESAKETRQSLENQLSDLIELEAISEGFKNQLTTSLSNVQWQIPKQVELDASFEIILTANVNDALAGQVFIAELTSDSSLEFVSSISAEAQAIDGQLQWRWRAKGVSESQTAQVNLYIHQDIQYQEDRVLRQVYRDQKILSLVNDNLFEKYGFWVIAIFAGLMGGFLIGKLNKAPSSNV
ncbi:effector protein B, substrate of the Dot/Icm secretion system [Marinomonas sp. MED121]|uniref:hypothetical protein n=1 Tax=Marinomonas sp. MED121 TaxID=314277 RepID=UPI000068FFBD|nr:hypothetical protein [Marinomonas sp. MED121]EAQ66668.1 effector protein B, substrate of the Dot/Icm secretion system [Marinomonas sp. MED121]